MANAMLQNNPSSGPIVFKCEDFVLCREIRGC